MKEKGIKPNFSDLARRYGSDRKTVKKIWDNDGKPKRKASSRASRYDPYLEEISSLMARPSVSKKGVFMYLARKHAGEINWNYNTFKWYTRKKGIELRKAAVPHVAYETDPGEQMQVDWKENLIIHLSDGREIRFNVFSATLGFSRKHIFIYSATKTTNDFIRCTIEVFRRLGGTTKKLLTDNMSAIVSVKGSQKKVHPEISRFFADLDTELKLAKARTPQTKGKDENSNKFVKWIYPYDGNLDSEEELIDTIEHVIADQCNSQINTGTGLPPDVLFAKEKEYLRPLPGKVMLDSYIVEHHVETADSRLLVYHKGKWYSVPPECMNQRVDIYPIEDCIYIYFRGRLVAKHSISQKLKNYKHEHYRAAYEAVSGSSPEIEKRAEENLEKLERIGL